MIENEMQTIELILKVFAKGHDADTIATALELPLGYVETVLDIAEDIDSRSAEAVASRLNKR
ncbi:MAG: hypothetical protein IJ744_07360 [Lachnospiraceae bacterium]|nr:hypothetical protein [Lachnospiraceae bacterium]